MMSDPGLHQATTSGRRRRTGGHHATRDVDFSPEEYEFLKAIEDFKRATGRQFPTWTDALSVLRSLGWIKPPAWESLETDSIQAS